MEMAQANGQDLIVWRSLVGDGRLQIFSIDSAYTEPYKVNIPATHAYTIEQGRADSQRKGDSEGRSSESHWTTSISARIQAGVHFWNLSSLKYLHVKFTSYMIDLLPYLVGKAKFIDGRGIKMA